MNCEKARVVCKWKSEEGNSMYNWLKEKNRDTDIGLV